MVQWFRDESLKAWGGLIAGIAALLKALHTWRRKRKHHRTGYEPPD